MKTTLHLLLAALIALWLPACGDDEPTGTGLPVIKLPPKKDHGPDPDEPDIDVWVDADEPDVVEDIADAPDVPDVPDVEDAADVPDEDTGPIGPQPDYVVCDAGDEAWAKQAVTALLGRRPAGIREVRVLVDLIEATDRKTVARALMNSDEFLARWQAWFMDELRVNRAGDKAHPECYGAPLVADDEGQLAGFIRDTDAFESDYGAPFNMTDVLLSSLRLDDLSPLYRAHLFAMMAKPITGANVSAVAMDITRRQDFGEIFESTYLHRNTVCAGCHNSKGGTTDSPDPETDRHWPLPGLLERGVYGADGGKPEMIVYTIFRHLNVVRSKGGNKPWQMSAVCGRFQTPGTIKDDPAEFEAFFIKELGLNASVWDTEASLKTGFDALRANGSITIDEETLEVEGHEAFAYLVSHRIVNQVWREIQGYPLTLVHYFPRNEQQHDILLELVTHFVTEQWSLKTLLLDIVTHPLFNDNAPIDGCGPDTGNPYSLPPVFNPWVIEETIEAEQANSVGDGLHRLNARVLLHSLATSMGWADTPPYPNGKEETFQKAVGVFVKDAEPGFEGVDFQGLLTWEARYGACEAQGVLGADPNSCVGNCGGQAPGGCWCDDQCAGFGDCCTDNISVCVDGNVPDDQEAFDWIKLLEATVTAWPEDAEQPLTVSDVVAALKDRLLTAPDVDPVEAPLIAALMQLETGLETPLSEVENWADRLRRVCGVLVETPQFMLAGIAPPDQLTAPALIVGQTSYQQHCEALSSELFDPKQWTVTCEENDLTVIEAEPPPEE